MTRTATRTNRYAATCQTCRTHIPAGQGTLTRDAEGAWIVRCAGDCAPAAPIATFSSGTLTADQLAHLDRLGFDLFTNTDAEMHAALVAAGFTVAPLPAPAQTTPARKPRGSRRKACVTGGNCASHTGRNCGGHDCDAN